MENNNAPRQVVESPSLSPRRSLPVDRRAIAFVAAVWFLMMTLALFYAWSHGFRYVTIWDEWILVPMATGDWPLTLATLWEPFTDHRIPLPKLILWCLYRVTNFDFRAGAFFNVVALGGLALVYIWAARRMRGSTRWTDAIFPLALLHWGQCNCFLFGFHVQFLSSTIFAGVLLALVASQGLVLSISAGILGGLCLLLLPLCGSNGVPYVVMMGAWLGVGSVRMMKSSAKSRQFAGVVTALLALAAFSVAGLYLVGFGEREGRHETPDAWTLFRSTYQFLAMGFGPAAIPVWKSLSMLALTCSILSFIVLMVGWIRRPFEWYRNLGLFLFLITTIGLAIAIAWARSGMNADCALDSHYVVLLTQIWCAMYFVWGTTTATLSRIAHCVIFAVFVLVAFGNLKPGFEIGEDIRARKAAFSRDLVNRTPRSILTQRYTEGPLWVCPVILRQAFGEFLARLQEAKIGPYGDLPPETEVALVENSDGMVLRAMTREGSVCRGITDDSFMVFQISQPRFVHAIRITGSYVHAASPANLQIFWRLTEKEDFTEASRNARFELATDEPHSVTAIVDTWVDAIRLDPDTKPFTFRLEEIAAWVPGTARALRGLVDEVSDANIAGWAYDKHSPGESLQLDIYDGLKYVATVTADQFREDLLAAGIGNGHHGFSVSTPDVFKDGQSHTMHVYVSGTRTPVPGSPSRFQSLGLDMTGDRSSPVSLLFTAFCDFSRCR